MVPTVRVSLIKLARLLPGHSSMVHVQVKGDVAQKPMLLHSSELLVHEHGVQVLDTLLQSTGICDSDQSCWFHVIERLQEIGLKLKPSKCKFVSGISWPCSNS